MFKETTKLNALKWWFGKHEEMRKEFARLFPKKTEEITKAYMEEITIKRDIKRRRQENNYIEFSLRVLGGME